MKLSIITVTYNSSKTILDTVKSVNSQTYQNIEHIIVDGNSKDNTVELINSIPNRVTTLVSENDNGIYDAMNKGIKLAQGDVIGILNSDDFLYHNRIIELIASILKDKSIDAVYGDVVFVNPSNLNKTVRSYSSANFKPNKFKFGFMPAHPSFYVRSRFFDQFGLYNDTFKIAADFELLIRFLHEGQVNSFYLNQPIVKMRTGGISNKSIKSNIILNKEILRACRMNNIKTNHFFIYSKYFRKIFELFR